MTAGVVRNVAGARGDVHVTGRRVVATFADGLLLGGLYALMAALFGTYTRVDTFGWEATMPAVPTVAYALIAVLYYVLMEGYLGQTFGKMLLGIEVVREDTGEAPGIGGAAIRTLLRIVDGLLGYTVAFVAVIATEKRQRLGDMAARTLVVRK